MPANSTLGELSASEYEQLQSCADRFANAAGSVALLDWEPYINGVPGNVRQPLIYELIKIDLEAGWRRGERPLLEDYLRRFPELGMPSAQPAHLIFEEFRIRTRHGDKPAVSDYQDRFPDQFGQLEKMALEPASRPSTPPPPPPPMRTPIQIPTPSPGPMSISGSMSAAAASPQAGASALIVLSTAGYELVHFLGSGQFGEVWRASGPGGVEVAVKVVQQVARPDSARRELGALELVKNLRHPFLLQTHGFWVQDGRLYIVMDLAQGSLRDRLVEYTKQGLPGVPAEELVPLIADAAEGLDFLHDQGVLHRDIKPDNLLMLYGHAKVADFGLAKPFDPGISVSFAGTPVYMAPESWGNKSCEASDQYSLAFTYAELRQGRRPVVGNDFLDLYFKLQEGQLDLDGVTAAERVVLMKAMAKDPLARYPSCSAFVTALADAVGVPTRRSSGTIAMSATRKQYQKPGNEPNQLLATGSMAMDKLLIPTNMGAGQSYSQVPDRTKSHAPINGGVAPPIDLEFGSGPREKPVEERKKKSTLPLVLAASLGIIAAGIGAGVYFSPGGTTVPTNPTTQSTSPNTDPDRTNPTTPATNTPPTPPSTRTPPTKLPPTKPTYLPDDRFKVVDDAEIKEVNGRQLASAIQFQPAGSKHPVVFQLIRPKSPTLRPFYIMERKAWNGMVRAFKDEKKPEEFTGTAWDDMAGEDLPAFNLRAGEAALCAKWAGGSLPTPAQWDAAAGLGDNGNRQGSVGLGGVAATGVGQPRSVFEGKDKSPEDIYDMAGNGREWTREIWSPGNAPKSVPLADANNQEPVVTRGRMFISTLGPLTYEDLTKQQKEPQTQHYNAPSPFTGFRVVIEIPPVK